MIQNKKIKKMILSLAKRGQVIIHSRKINNVASVLTHRRLVLVYNIYILRYSHNHTIATMATIVPGCVCLSVK